jgi:hypothetical protein
MWNHQVSVLLVVGQAAISHDIGQRESQTAREADRWLLCFLRYRSILLYHHLFSSRAPSTSSSPLKRIPHLQYVYLAEAILFYHSLSDEDSEDDSVKLFFTTAVVPW